ncbi:hypothetical protein DCS_05088 [Drechmeria coniospora]|uniref:Uncharacterized protein n=1 Tax=Drechmeria coniospora TaxID=98403 RepID=A0A151GLT8_DRECN|nr:hypothetical protein DCS_05088 [Drechmeria coniospora]KYK58075.1 hypothetical protein DCS_05088 [Drechmeria coniospora]
MQTFLIPSQNRTAAPLSPTASSSIPPFAPDSFIMKLANALLSATLASASAISGTGPTDNFDVQLTDRFYKPVDDFFGDVIAHKNDLLSEGVHRWIDALHNQVKPFIETTSETELEFLPHLAKLNSKFPALVDQVQVVVSRSKPWVQDQRRCSDARTAVGDLRSELTFFADFLYQSLKKGNWKADQSADTASKKDEVDVILARLTQEFKEGSCVNRVARG